jgi:hypothetical protein
VLFHVGLRRRRLGCAAQRRAEQALFHVGHFDFEYGQRKCGCERSESKSCASGDELLSCAEPTRVVALTRCLNFGDRRWP